MQGGEDCAFAPVIVLEVEIENVALVEFKGEPLVAVHPNWPSALLCTYEQMKEIAGPCQPCSSPH